MDEADTLGLLKVAIAAHSPPSELSDTGAPPPGYMQLSPDQCDASPYDVPTVNNDADMSHSVPLGVRRNRRSDVMAGSVYMQRAIYPDIRF
jgi:hypothetical protein